MNQRMILLVPFLPIGALLAFVFILWMDSREVDSAVSFLLFWLLANGPVRHLIDALWDSPSSRGDSEEAKP